MIGVCMHRDVSAAYEADQQDGQWNTHARSYRNHRARAVSVSDDVLKRSKPEKQKLSCFLLLNRNDPQNQV